MSRRERFAANTLPRITLRCASCRPRRSQPDGEAFLCAEVKASLEGHDVAGTLLKQVFPFMKLSNARYGLITSTRTGTDGKVQLDTHLVDRTLTRV